IEGQFHVKVPFVTPGYEKNPPSLPSGAIAVAMETTGETLLHLFITLEPPLAQPEKLKLKFQSEEDDRLLRYAAHWQTTSPHPARLLLTTTLNMAGQTTLVTRYVHPQRPPRDLITLTQLHRFVSLVPHLPARTAFAASDCTLWATTEEVLEIGAGDAAEHAIMLCNFFLYGNALAWVVWGRGIPEGRTAYVLVREDGAARVPAVATGAAGMLAAATAAAAATSMPGPAVFRLFNPVTGEKYELRDSHCPLKEIGCVFNGENIWGNIQRYADPARMNFDFHDLASWRPLFLRSFPKPELPSVQMEHPVYKSVSDRWVKNLEEKIERAVVSAVEEWRSFTLTRWNRLTSRMLHPLLVHLEKTLLTTSEFTHGQLLSASKELETTRSVYSLFGSPLNMPFTDIRAVLDAVHATDVHGCAADRCEFALAVHVRGYPGGVASVWVWVAG
ncbi:hypothetical protein BDK51DRAFT_34945, partial [Blyttiomyces helicus]